MAYSLDLRKKVVEAVRSGSTKIGASRRFGVGAATVFNRVSRKSLLPKRPPEGHKRKLDREALSGHVREFPDATLEERARVFGIHRSTVGHALAKAGITRKKSPEFNERDHGPGIRFLSKLRKLLGAGRPIAYADESGFERDVFRLFGWTPRGRRVNSGKPGPRTNLIAAKFKKKLLAPFLFEGATDSNVFADWLENQLFQELPRNAVVIMDNASFHKTAKVREVFENSGFTPLYPPPYSPDLNPIRRCLRSSRKGGSTPRTRTIWTAS